jgi:hypothetical protein
LYIVIFVFSTAIFCPNVFLKFSSFKHSFVYAYLFRISGTASKSDGCILS